MSFKKIAKPMRFSIRFKLAPELLKTLLSWNLESLRVQNQGKPLCPTNGFENVFIYLVIWQNFIKIYLKKPGLTREQEKSPGSEG